MFIPYGWQFSWKKSKYESIYQWKTCNSWWANVNWSTSR